MLVEMGEQLKATLTANAALQQDHASLTTEVERLRGYRWVADEQREINFDEPGEYVVDDE